MPAPAKARWQPLTHTAAVMGTVASIRVIAAPAAPPGTVGAACRAAVAGLRRAEATFSTFREDSAISRIRRGELLLRDAGPEVAEVAAACEAAREETGGLFDAWWRGWFDPTGYVKGWAAERAARDYLQPLLGVPGVHACCLNVGGDMQAFTNPGCGWEWEIGIADPGEPGRILARVRLEDGAVATSGPAERGAHIIDPRTGRPASGVASATAVADSLAVADVWATAGVAAGPGALPLLLAAPLRSGLLVGADGTVHRWAGGIEVTGPGPLTLSASGAG